MSHAAKNKKANEPLKILNCHIGKVNKEAKRAATENSKKVNSPRKNEESAKAAFRI
jgi:hypothetical protein